MFLRRSLPWVGANNDDGLVFKELEQAYYNYQTQLQKLDLYQKLDSIYAKFAYSAKRRFELGETNYLENVTAKAKQKEITIQKNKAIQEVKNWLLQLQLLVQSKDSLVIKKETPNRLDFNSYDLNVGLEKQYLENRLQLSIAQKHLQNQGFLPDLSLEYFQGTNNELDNTLYGVQFGIKLPLLFFGQKSKAKAAKLQADIVATENILLSKTLQKEKREKQNLLSQYDAELTYYENEGKVLSEQLLKVAQAGFKNGEIDFFQYIQTLENAYTIELNYLEALNQYNQTLISINYLSFSN